VTRYPQMVRSTFTYHIVGKFGGEKVWQIYLFWTFSEKKFGKWIDLAKKIIIVNRNLDGFSLANQGWFAEFAKLSPYTVIHFVDTVKAKQILWSYWGASVRWDGVSNCSKCLLWLMVWSRATVAVSVTYQTHNLVSCAYWEC